MSVWLSRDKLKRFIRSVWFFPAVLAVPLIILTAFQIHGSSIGTYYKLFYGDSKNDPDIVLNRPQSIRSDEWLVNTQLTIAQKNNHFKRVNQNIGNGEDVSLTGEAPYKEWSTLFRPQNWVFFILPFDNAFAFRWWLMGYLLIVSCYFFIFSLLPSKRLLAALIGLSVFLAPFVQWWYLYGTLGTLFYAFFGATVFIKLINAKRQQQQLLWGLLLAYIITCFALILYPPFQVPVALAVLAFAIGSAVDSWRGLNWKAIWQRLLPILGALVIAAGITLFFLDSRSGTINAIRHTAYPGNRIQHSGGWQTPQVAHLFSGHLNAQLEFASKASHYRISGPTNQSEASNFILLLPFLLLPSIYLISCYRKKERRFDWSLILVNSAFILSLVWLLVPGLDFIGKLTQLERVTHSRIIIGLGLLSLIQMILFIRRYQSLKNFIFRRSWVVLYTIAVFFIELMLGFYAKNQSPGFISNWRILAFALPVPIIIYLILRKRWEWAAAGLLLFSLAMTFRVNPLYRGTEVIDKTPVSLAIKEVVAKDDSAWAVEHFLLENFAYMNGARSLSGVYFYPQLNIWQTADPLAPESLYNRYAHTVFEFDRDPTTTVPTRLHLNGEDSFGIITEPCSDFLQKQHVRYLLTAAQLNPADSCARLVKQINYPAVSFYIYKLNF